MDGSGQAHLPITMMMMMVLLMMMIMMTVMIMMVIMMLMIDEEDIKQAFSHDNVFFETVSISTQTSVCNKCRVRI